MPGMNFNRNKRPDNGASRRGLLHSRLAQRAIAIVGALALVVAGIGTFTMTAQADPHPINKDIVADNSTLGNWSGEVGIENTTENVGRIWTDKTVQANDIKLSNDSGSSIDVEKGSSDFLVGLSALSSMSNTVTTSSTPLDIVLVLDMSGSMSQSMTTGEQVTYNEVYSRNVQGSDAVERRSGRNTYYVQQDPGEYYVLVDGEYVRVQEAVTQETHQNRWGRNQQFNVHEYWYVNGADGSEIRVTPKTSQNDNTEGHYQFYTQRTQELTTTKINALKTAVNQFIETTDQANASMPEGSKHEISIVKFANDVNNEIGNDRYYLNSSNPNVNYSQVVTDFTSDATALENYMDRLNPAGATQANYGMQLAQRVINGNSQYGLKGARDNSKRIVIFFTDGEPNNSSGWNGDVADSAIDYAHQMKTNATNPVTIYSIGVFEDADPSDTTDNSFNGYMNAVSSNYPNATGYIGEGYWGGWGWVSPNMGDRAPDSNYYMAATSSTELDDIFKQISEDLNNGTGAPTQTGGKDTETTSGYITITDQLGAYMKFDGMKEIVFAGKEFINVSGPTPDTTDGYEGWQRYAYEGEANSDIYPSGNLDQLIIRVKPGSDLATGDTVQVQIPASLIPTRYFDVDATDKTMSVTDTYPIRIFYGVSLKSYVADSIAAGAPMGTLTQDEYNALDTYVKSNQYTKGEGDNSTAYARFYSNAYSSGENGTTISSFEPSDGNEFYYFTKPTTIYSDEACNNPVKSPDEIQDGQSYYYKNTFWQFADPDNAKTDGTKYAAVETFTPFGLTAAQARQLATGRDADGNLCIPQGTRHMVMISQIVTNKETNPTGTATSVIKPNWVGSGTSETIDAALGNNGRLGIELPGTLSVTKHIKVPTGVDETQFADTEFPFQINMDDASNYTFKAQVKNADGTIANPGTDEEYFDLAFDAKGHSAEVNLKSGQTLTVYGLGDGWEYGVTENGTLPGFKLTDPANGLAQGTIDQAAPAQVEFTNTYSFNEDEFPVISGETDLDGTKKLTPRAWQDGDHFEFELMVATGSEYADGTSVPTDAQPMPTDGEKQENGNVRISLTNDQANDATADTPVEFNFGDIEYTAPGTYNYIIREVPYNDGDEGNVAGITYDLTRYYVQVTVTDNGDGTLDAVAHMYTTHDENGATVPNLDEEVQEAAFTNTWSADAASVAMEGVKNYSDSTEPGTTTPPQNAFYFRITAQDGGPLPQLPTGNPIAQGDDYMVVTTLPAGTFTFGNATFTSAMVDHTYTYDIQEVIKQGDNYVPVSEAIEENDAGAYVQNGMTYDATEYTLTVTVQAGANGTLEAVPVYSNGTDTVNQPSFTNSYDPADATLTGDAAIHGAKTLTGRDMTENESFTFTLAGADTATTTAMTDGTITFGGQSLATYTQNVSGAVEDTATGFNFGDMVINKDGTYTFSMSETGYTDGTNTYADAQLNDRINGIEFDSHVCTVTVKVTDENGQLNATVAYNSTEDDGPAFTNRYTARTTYGPGTNLTVAKTLTGRDMKADDFTFEIAATGDNDNAAQAKLTEANISPTFTNQQGASSGMQVTWQILSNLAFNQEDAGKTFTYQVREQIPAENERAGVTYDESVYEVAIQVIDNADGSMHTVTTVTKGDEQVGIYDSSTGTVTPTLAFANTYKGAPVTADPKTSTYLQLYKVVTGRPWLDRDSFNFTMTKVSYNGASDAEALAVMPNPGNDGEVTLGGTAQAGTKAGQSVPFDFGSMTFTEAGTYVYRVDETNDGNDGQGLTYDDHTVDLTIVINDNGEGNLVVGPVYPTGSRTFTNNYTAEVNYADAVATLSTQKTLNGHAMAEDQFEFTVTPADQTSAEKVGLWDNDAIQSATGSWDAGDAGQPVTTDINWNPVFNQADNGKTFTYTFAEVVPDPVPAGYAYDGTTYTVAITPTDNLDGTMSVETVVTTKPAEGDETTETYTYNTGDEKADIVLPFVNTYGANATTGDVAADVTATKTLTGRDMNENEFSFEIVTRDANPDDGAEFTPTTVATGKNAAAKDGEAGDVTFTDGDGDAMTYTIAKLDQAVAEGYATKKTDDAIGNATWTLNYTALEDTSALPNKVSATGTTSFDFTVTAEDDGEGHLTATVKDVPEGGFAFQNTYTPDSVTVGTDGAAQIVVQKTFTGRANNEWLDSDSFTFTITAETDGAPMPDPATVEVTKQSTPVDGVDGAYQAIFSNVDFTKDDLDGAMEKQFVYTITETSPDDSGSGITKDGHTAQVTVTVTDDGSGKLKASVKYNNDDAKTDADKGVKDAAAFTNTYAASVDYTDAAASLSAQKTLNGHAMAENQFQFTVTPDDEASAKKVGLWDDDQVQSKTLSWGAGADGEQVTTAVDLGLTFNQTDSGKTYTYNFAEVVPNPAPAGYSYDRTTYTVAITPTDNQNGTMSVQTVVTKTPVEGEATVSTYTYSADDAKDDIALPFVNTYTAGATGDVAAQIDATKTLTGRDMKADEFKFEIVTRKADGFDGDFTAATVATGTNVPAEDGNAGDVIFAGADGAMTYTIDKLDQAVEEGYATKDKNDDGNAVWTLSFTAKELAGKGDLPAAVTADDPTSFDFTVTVTDDGEGNLDAKFNAPEKGIAFKNTYAPDDVTVGADGAAQITVQKTFTGRSGNAWLEGDSFEFTIAAETDGAPMPENDKVVISSESNPENGVATGIFGDITYKKSDLGGAMTKAFVYDITETSPAKDGITKDGHTAKVTVTVTDDTENGKLVASVAYDNDDATTDADQGVDNAAAFTNTYNAGSGTLDGATYLKASKTLDGRDWQDGETVDLVLTGATGTPAPQGATDVAGGWEYRLTIDGTGKTDGEVIDANFPNIEYSSDVLGGKDSVEFTYTIKEDEGSHAIADGDTDQIHQGMVYSHAAYTVTVTVSDGGDGALDVNATMQQTLNDGGTRPDNPDVTTAAFVNAFDPHSITMPLTATKIYKDSTGGHPIANDMFTFMVKPVGDNAADAPMSDRAQGDGADRYVTAGVNVDSTGNASANFGRATLAFDGQNHTYYYEVTEVLDVDGTWKPVAQAITPNKEGAYIKDGVTYDAKTVTVVLDVAYDGDADSTTGTISYYDGTYDEVSQATEDELAGMKVDGITFSNSYGTEGTTVDTGDATTTANFTKVIDGRDWLGSDSFQFTITPQGDAPAFEDAEDGVKTVNVTAENDAVDKVTDADGQEVAVNGRSFNFGSVKFADANMEGAETDPKTGKLTKKFTYTVVEVQPEKKIPGMTYDGHTATLTITVVDNGDGTMTATPQVQNSVFTNTYSTSVDGAAFGGFQITKTLTGRDMTEGQFEFTVTPVDGTGTSAADAAAKLGITDDNKTVKSPAAEEGQTVTVGTFGLADGMTFTQDDAGKTFVYKVTESKKGGDGYTNDDATYRVEVAVAHDAQTATLTVTTTVFKGDEQVGKPIEVTNASTERATASVDFQNSYAASTDPGVGGTAATVSTTKTLVNRPLEAGEFTFQVAYAGGDQAVVKSDVTNAADGTVDFGSFEYDTASLAQMVKDRYATITNVDEDGNATWTIQYTASELTDGLADAGVSASKASFDFTITVVDNGNGSLTATAALPEDAGFTNTYSSKTEDGDPSVQMTPTGSKVIEAADGLTPNYDELVGKFTFTLSSDDPNAPMPEQTTATNDKDGNVTFGAIEFTLDDLNKALGTQDDAAEGDEGIDTQAVGGTPREHTFTYKVTESGSAAGITNDPNPVREFSYTVHDDGQGTLKVTSDPASATLFSFTNTYSVEPVESSPTGEGQLTITKTLTGRDMAEGEFTFVLTAPDGFMAPDGSTQFTATNAAAADGEAGAVTFDPITFTEPGTYEFTLEEQAGADNVGVGYDLDTYTITAKVKDNGIGGLDVTWRANGMGDSKEIDFQNTYEAAPASMGFGATKVLTGRDLTDGEFSFQVTDETGEKVYAVAKNDATGTVSFDPITFKQAGEYHLWISEVLPEDDDAATDGIQSERVTYDETRYELVVTVEDDGKGQLQVTNVAMADGSEPAPVFQNTYTKPEEPAKPVLPGGGSLEQTGDTMPLLLGVATVAGVALVAGGLAVRRKRGE